MEKTVKNQVWNFNDRIDAEVCAEGVERKILAYTDELMCVENHFKKGAVGALHHHPHTQITYVVSGSFEFEIDGVRRVIKPGDALLKRNDIEHGCVCLEDDTNRDHNFHKCPNCDQCCEQATDCYIHRQTAGCTSGCYYFFFHNVFCSFCKYSQTIIPIFLSLDKKKPERSFI